MFSVSLSPVHTTIQTYQFKGSVGTIEAMSQLLYMNPIVVVHFKYKTIVQVVTNKKISLSIVWTYTVCHSKLKHLNFSIQRSAVEALLSKSNSLLMKIQYILELFDMGGEGGTV